jgi:hypothetical protein
MDAGGRAPKVGALGDAGAIAETRSQLMNRLTKTNLYRNDERQYRRWQGLSFLIWTELAAACRKGLYGEKANQLRQKCGAFQWVIFVIHY